MNCQKCDSFFEIYSILVFELMHYIQIPPINANIIYLSCTLYYTRLPDYHCVTSAENKRVSEITAGSWGKRKKGNEPRVILERHSSDEFQRQERNDQ